MSLFTSLRSFLSAPAPRKFRIDPRGRRAGFESLETRAMLSAVSGDFNNDRFADVVIGMPTDTVGGKANAGSIQVIYGGITNQLVPGLRGDKVQTWNQDSVGMADTVEAGDQFGAALAVGDFNGDGFMDLAIGAPGESIGSTSGAGLVQILYGSASGLTATGSQTFNQGTGGIQGTAGANDGFGSALAVGDFNHDRIADLAIGIPGETVSSQAGAGAVSIIFGSRSKLVATNNQLWTQDSTGIEDTAAAGDHFGAALAAGDFNADAFADLAIGSPGETVATKAGAGGVNIIRGSSSGLTSTGNLFWTADTTGIDGDSIANGQFGFALAVGDFNDDSFMDLAVGAPGENVSAATTPITGGAVHVFMGSKNGSTITGSLRFAENSTGFTNSNAQNGDRFGAALTTARLGSDRFSDLVIGTPNDHATVNNADAANVGSLRILFGTRSATAALSASRSQFATQDISTLAGTAAANEFFGSGFATGDTNFDTFTDLIVDVPGQSGSGSFKGGFSYIQSGPTGLNANNSQDWSRNSSGTLESKEEKNLREGEAFLASNRLQPGVIRTESGLQYKYITRGSLANPKPTTSSQVHVIYRGTRLDGTVFDPSDPTKTTTDTTFSVTGVVPGFREALLLMHVGDKIELWIPARLAYGANPPGTIIQPNDVLHFTLELVGIV